MEWSWRTVLILLGLLMVVVIVIDGLRRMRRARAEALRLDVDPTFRAVAADDRNPELPGGGFRVVQKSAEIVSAGLSSVASAVTPTDHAPVRTPRTEPVSNFSALDDDALTDDEPLIPWQDELGDVRVIPDAKVELPEQPVPHSAVQDLDIPPSPLIPKARPVNLDEQVPVLLDVEELGAEEDSQPLIAPPDYEDKLPPETDIPQEPMCADDAPAESAAYAEAVADEPELEEEVAEIPPSLPLQPVNFASPEAEKLSARPEPDVVLEIHCIARDSAGFSGKDILFLFNSCDLRFGEKEIFHRFEQPDGKGYIQFSVAQSFNPGIFVPAAMAQQHFRGLSFFMSLPGAQKPLEAYEAMSGMAMVVARQLNADLFDGARSALTHQTIEHDRQTIIDFERRQRLAAKKHARI